MNVTTVARKASKAAVTPIGWSGRRRAGDVVVLLYHRVGDGGSEIELPAADLRRQFAYLAANERVLTLPEALAGAGGVVVTFDDGYRDFTDTVVPMLDTFQIPAVLYLATSLVGDGTDALSWEGLREAAATRLVTVGAHTHSHVNLAKVDESQAFEEMRRSQELIEQELGSPCRHFAYPWSVGSAAADRAARRLFDSAAWDAWRTNRAGQIDPYRLGRVPVLSSDGQMFFRKKVRGQLDSEALLYRALGRGPWGKA